MGVECFVGEVKFISHSLGCRRRRRMLTGLESIRARRVLRQQTHGQVLTGSPAGTASSGQLNPAHSGWLMGYPAVWDDCGVTAMPSSRSRGSLHPGQHDLARQSGGTLAAKDSTKKARVPDTWVRAFPLALTLANEAHKLFAHHGAYRRVVVMFRCPSSSCTSARSAPRSRKRVAKRCRRSYGRCASGFTPAFSQAERQVFRADDWSNFPHPSIQPIEDAERGHGCDVSGT